MSGNLVGPLCFKPDDAPRYPKGFIVVVVTAIAAGMLAMIYRCICLYINRKRDKSGVMEGFEHAYEDDLTDVKVGKPVRLPQICGPADPVDDDRTRSFDTFCEAGPVYGWCSKLSFVCAECGTTP